MSAFRSRRPGPRVAGALFWRRRVRAEAGPALRAAVSSIVATVVDGLVYEFGLAVAQAASLRGPYIAASAGGAVVGAITNFSLNRWWAFRSREKSIVAQGTHYAAGSFVTLLVLQALLWVFVEHMAIDARIAWPPAKVLSWLVFSYPFQRIIVFPGASRCGSGTT